MKNIIKTFAVAGALSLLFASCAKEQSIATPEVNYVAKTITVSLETPAKTVIGQDADHMYAPYFAGESLKVVGYNGTEYKVFSFGASGSISYPSASGTFTCEEWEEGYEPKFVADTYASTSFTYADGKLLVMSGTNTAKESTQRLGYRHSYPASAATHIGNFDDNSEMSVLKNASSLIGIKVSRDDIKSIRISAIGEEKIAGFVNVSTDEFFSGNPDNSFVRDATKQTYDYTDIVPIFEDLKKDDICVFPQDEYFYAAIIPGTYAQGLRFTITNAAGIEVSRDIAPEGGLTFKCGGVRKIEKAIDEDLAFKDLIEATTFPDDFTIDLTFWDGSAVWPFQEEIVATDNQTVDGETYTYRYIIDEFADADHNYYKDINFTISKGEIGWTYTSHKTNGLVPAYSGATKTEWNSFYVYIPGIPGRRISDVTVTSGNTTTHTMYLCSRIATSDEDKATCSLATLTGVGNSIAASFNMDKSEFGQGYYLYRNSYKTLYLKDLSVTYSDKGPETITISAVSGTNVWYYDNGSTATNIGTGSSSATAADFWHKDYPDYKFEVVDQSVWYSTGLNFLSGSGYVKLPNIAGYRLASLYLKGGNAANTWTQLKTYNGSEYEDLTEQLSTSSSDTEGITHVVPTTTGAETAIYFQCKSKFKATTFTLTYSRVD